MSVAIDLQISLTAQERDAWLLIRPKLKAYLSLILHVYRQAPPAIQLELRAHNPILDAVLDMLGE